MAFLSYYAGPTVPKRDAKLQKTLDRVLSACAYALPSFDPEHPKFDARRYWRGRAWAIINYLVARGRDEHGFKDKVRRIRLDTRKLIQNAGFFE